MSIETLENVLKKWSQAAETNWTGYVWWSSEKEPVILDSEKLPGWPKDDHLQEALLKNDSRSLTVLFKEGVYQVSDQNLEETDQGKVKYFEETVLVRGKPWTEGKISGLKLGRILREQNDDACQSWPTLVPSSPVFFGFVRTADAGGKK